MQTLTARLSCGERGLSEWGGRCVCVTLVFSATIYSFQLTSFLIAKELVVCVGLIALVGFSRHAVASQYSACKLYLPLWIALAVALCLGIFQDAAQAVRCEDALRFASWLLFATLACPFLALPCWRDRFITSLIGSASVVAFLGLLQYGYFVPELFPVFSGYGQRVYSVFGNQDLFGGYLALVAPLVLARFLSTSSSIRSRAKAGSVRAACIALLLLLLWGIFLSRSRSAWLACFVGFIVVMWEVNGHKEGEGGELRKLGPYWAGILAILLVVFLLAWPGTRERILGSFGQFDVGGRGRLWYWDGTFRMIASAPWLGVGLGAYGYWSPKYLGGALHAPSGEKHYHNELHTVHAHSEPLEIMAETGVLGILLWGWFLVRFLRTVRLGVSRRSSRGEYGALAALGVFSCFNAAFHSAPHALAGLLLVGVLFSARGDFGESKDAVKGVLGWVFLVGASIFLVILWWWTVLVPSYLLGAAEDVHVAGRNPVLHYERLFAHGWPNAKGREEWGMALLDMGNPEEAYTQLQRALPGRDTGRLYLLLGVAASQTGRNYAARAWLEECLVRWPTNGEAYALLFALTEAGERDEIARHGARWKLPGNP